MRRGIVLVGLVVAATGVACAGPKEASPENFVAAVADIPGEPRAKLVIGNLACSVLGSEPRKAQAIDDLTGEIYTQAEATVLIEAAEEYLCP